VSKSAKVVLVRITRLVAALLFSALTLKFRFLGPAAAAGGRGVYVSERW
jgi:hypothetical protein